MLAAVIGDTVGSVYEWNNTKSTRFPLFSPRSHFTDDSVMTLAVAQALVDAYQDGTDLREAAFADTMRRFGNAHPRAGYGGRFFDWLQSPNPRPYGSFGNGSAMRVSSVAWVSDDLREVEELARATALVSHNRPEGIKGAQAVAACILLARTGASNDDIRTYVQETHGYDLDFTLDEIRPAYGFDVSCQGSVPQAIVAFLESTGFEDAIRLAVSIGGDSDTIAAIAASIAQGRYEVPESLVSETRARLTADLKAADSRFCQLFMENRS